MWWYLFAPMYYISRALEDGHVQSLIAGAFVIALLAYWRPRGWVLWSILTWVLAVFLAAEPGSALLNPPPEVGDVPTVASHRRWW